MTSFIITEFPSFVEHDIGYQPSKFECSRMFESNFMERVEPPPQCYNEIKKLSAYGVKKRSTISFPVFPVLSYQKIKIFISCPLLKLFEVCFHNIIDTQGLFHKPWPHCTNVRESITNVARLEGVISK